MEENILRFYGDLGYYDVFMRILAILEVGMDTLIFFPIFYYDPIL